jgi:hypothetical protein
VTIFGEVFQEIVGRLGPNEGPWILVADLDVTPDRAFEFSREV